MVPWYRIGSFLFPAESFRSAPFAFCPPLRRLAVPQNIKLPPPAPSRALSKDAAMLPHDAMPPESGPESGPGRGPLPGRASLSPPPLPPSWPRRVPGTSSGAARPPAGAEPTRSAASSARARPARRTRLTNARSLARPGARLGGPREEGPGLPGPGGPSGPWRAFLALAGLQGPCGPSGWPGCSWRVLGHSGSWSWCIQGPGALRVLVRSGSRRIQGRGAFRVLVLGHSGSRGLQGPGQGLLSRRKPEEAAKFFWRLQLILKYFQ